MDVAEIRHRNLIHLVATIESGPTRLRKKDVALALDMGASFLSQLIAGKKMGDDVARKLEVAQKLSRGWMDQPQWPAEGIQEERAIYSRASQPLRTDPSTLAASIQLVRLAHDALGADFNPEDVDDAEIVLLGCAWLNARSEASVTVDNVVDFTKLLRARRGGDEKSEGSTSTGRSGRSSRGQGAAAKTG